MDGEYLSDLSSSCDEEQQPSQKRSIQKNNDANLNDINNYNNSNNNNNNNNSNDNANYANSYADAELYDRGNVMNSREREQFELQEAIRLSLLETGMNKIIIPKKESNYNSYNNRNSTLKNNQLRSNSRHRHHHRNRDDDNDNNNQNVNQETNIEQIILQSKKEEEDTKAIREYVSSRQQLITTLKDLPGVDPDDPCFMQFYE